MDRAIYCPSEEMLAEANGLAFVTFLPILLSDNEKTKNLDFDRSVVSVIKIPEYEIFRYSHESVQVGFRQHFMYENDFEVLRGNTELNVDGNILQPAFEEKHKVKWNYITTRVGQISASLHVMGKLKEQVSFNVY